MALTLLIVTLTVVALVVGSSANPHQSDRYHHQQQQSPPPVFVIQDGSPQTRSGQSLARHWNNQRLIARPSSASSATTLRKAKQIFYTDDEPVPYYHSYKSTGLGSGGEGAHVDQYYQPLRRNQHGGTNGDELPWYSRGYIAAAAGGGSTPRVQQAAMAPVSSAGTKSGGSARRTNGAGSTKSRSRPPAGTGGRRRSQPKRPAFAAEGDPLASPDLVNGTRSSSGRKNLVCYYGTWAVYRPDAGRYPVENIDPFLCTHIIYGFTGLSYDNLIKPLDPWNDLEDNYGKGAMKRFTNLKRINPDLKTLVAIGGWNEGSIKYSKMASEPEARAKFVKSVVDFLAKYNFDGLDLDWEYPGARGGHSYDKQNFVKLLRELKEAFAPHGYLLTAAVSAGKWFIDPAYDIAQVSKYLDLINLMAYDYHGGWETKTGMNAPLFHSAKHDKRDEAQLNVNWSVNYWLQQGAAPEKIMLGVGSYGRSFTLDKANSNGINAPASQKGQAGPYTREPGSLGYNEICEAFQRQPQSWTIVRDPDYLAPYAYNERQWVGYDDMESLALKAQYAKSMGLGGMMMWSIETDDFQGRCHQEKYPLLNTIRRVLDGAGAPDRPATPRPPASGTTTRRPTQPARPPSGPPSTSARPAVTPTTPGQGEVEDDVRPTSSTTTRRPTPTRPASTTSRRPAASSSRRPQRPTTSTSTTTTSTQRPATGGSEFVCRADGMFADPRNCRKFIRCVSAGRNYSIFRFDCAPGTAFNEQQQYCDHIYNVPTCKSHHGHLYAAAAGGQYPAGQIEWHP